MKPSLPSRSGTAAVLVVLTCFAGRPAAAPEPDADAAEILRRAEEVRNPQVDYAVDFTITTRDPASSVAERTSAYTLIAHGKDRSLVFTLVPDRLFGATLLIDEGRFWLLLPRALKPWQLSPRQQISGDVANGDLARANLSRHYRPRLDGEEEVDGRPCWRLELSAADDLAGYPRIRAWIGQESYRPRKLEYFGHTGALLRTAYYRDYRDGELGVRAMRIEVESATTGGGSTLTFSQLRRIDVSGLRFDPEALVDVRDAALAVRKPGPKALRAEEVVEALAAWNR